MAIEDRIETPTGRNTLLTDGTVIESIKVNNPQTKTIPDKHQIKLLLAENSRLRGIIESQMEGGLELYNSYIQSQLEIKELRDSYSVTNAYLEGVSGSNEWTIKARAALSKSFDASALRNYVANRMRVMTRNCIPGIEFPFKAIREYADKYERGEIDNE